MSRLRIGLLAALVVAVAGIAVWGAVTLAPRHPSSPPSLDAAVKTAVVTRQTISDQQQETGTIGYSAAYAVVNQYTPPASAASLAQDRDAVSSAQQALSDIQAQNAFTEQQDANAVAAAATQAAADQARAKLQGDQLADATKLHQAQAALRTAQDQYNAAQQPGGGGGGGGGQPAIYTALPAVGQTVSRGQALYAVSGRPIPLLYGSIPIGRQLTVGASGADVQELEDNLSALGYGAGLVADGNFTQADATAVKRWQADLGVAQTGMVNPGDAAVLPAPLRVAQVKVAAGASAQAGAEIIDGTSSTPVVTVNLDARDQALAKVGESVDVHLPSAQDVKGNISAVGAVATTTGQGSSQTTTIPVTVALADGSAASRLEGASVTVDLISDTHANVLTVPINALLAVPGGGYAVETADGTHRRIPVTTGIFSNSQVEVSGAGLVEGLEVESPSL